MNIAIDIDGVLGDDVGAFVKFHNEKYNTNLKKQDFYCNKWWLVLNEEVQVLYKKYLEYIDSNYFKDMGTIKGSIEALKELGKNHNLFVLTARKNEWMDVTKKWLDKNFPGIFNEIYSTNFHTFKKKKGVNKGEICKRIKADYLIDDFVEHANECTNVGTEVLLLDSPWNQNYELLPHIYRMKDWNEIIEYINRQ